LETEISPEPSIKIYITKYHIPEEINFYFTQLNLLKNSDLGLISLLLLQTLTEFTFKGEATPKIY